MRLSEREKERERGRVRKRDIRERERQADRQIDRQIEREDLVIERRAEKMSIVLFAGKDIAIIKRLYILQE